MAWNKPTEGNGKIAPGKTTGKPLSPAFVIAVIAIVAAIGAACCFLFFASTRKPAEEAVKTEVKKPAEEITFDAAKAPTNVVEEEQGVRYTRNGTKIKVPRNPWGTPIPKDLEYKPQWEYTPEDYARIDPGYADRHERFLKRQAANPWKTGPDSMLSVLLFSELGKPNALVPFSPRFKDQFLKSLETPIIVSQDDPPELQEQKRKMIETKIWLKEQLDEGQDIVQILNDELARQKKIQGLRDNLMRELREVQKTAKSIEEVQDYVDAANQMLEREGGAKVGLPMKYTQLLIDRRAAQTQAE